MVALALGFALLQSPVPGRYDLGYRLKQLDVAWIAVESKSSRQKAVPQLAKAVTSFFVQDFAAACRALDEARSALLDQVPSDSDGITLRLIPAVIEPGAKATVRATWAYLPVGTKPVQLRVGREYKTLDPGQSLEFEVEPTYEAGSADSASLRDLGATVTVVVGGEPRSLFVSVLKNFRSRIERLAASKDPHVKSLGDLAKASIDAQGTLEQDAPVLELVNLAETLEAKEKQIWQVENWPIVKHNQTTMRIAFPSRSLTDPAKSEPLDVVIGFHGSGGSENLFFEGYGRGAAVKEALARGWAFVAPAVHATCGVDVLDWLTNVRKIRVGRIFLIGHSSGTAAALRSFESNRNVAALALLAPVAIPQEAWSKTPLFVGVGAQELTPIAAIASQIRSRTAARSDCVSRTFANCEHLMIVAEAARDAFSFFDGIKRTADRPPGDGGSWQGAEPPKR